MIGNVPDTLKMLLPAASYGVSTHFRPPLAGKRTSGDIEFSDDPVASNRE
jgi:hypothetical protein